MNDPDRDLYCFGCGYNLRGLSGDLLRCPECGNLNPLADLKIPAEKIKKAIRDLVAGPALCTFAFVVLSLWQLPTLYHLAIRNSRNSPPPLQPFDLSISQFVVAVIVWVVGVFLFRSSCGAKPGWFNALARFTLLGSLMTVSGAATIVSGIWAINKLATSPTHGDFLKIGAGGLVSVISVISARWFYRRATAVIAPLQRECAVRLARQA